MSEPAAGVMRMSTDDDDLADQQDKLADPRMAETDNSVLKKMSRCYLSKYTWVTYKTQKHESAKVIAKVCIKRESVRSLSCENLRYNLWCGRQIN